MIPTWVWIAAVVAMTCVPLPAAWAIRWHRRRATPPADPPNWVRGWQLGIEYVDNRDGVDWYDAPPPPNRHTCQAQSRAQFYHGGTLDLVERCACGALRYDGNGPWIGRNTRRKETELPT